VTQIAASSSPTVDPELERVGRDHRQQLAGRQPPSISRRCCGV